MLYPNGRECRPSTRSPADLCGPKRVRRTVSAKCLPSRVWRTVSSEPRQPRSVNPSQPNRVTGA
eukprot:3983535-Pyramimonas_sp.AAC.1